MTINYEVVPIITNPYYSFSISLNKVAYNLTMRYSTRESCWYMDIKTNDNVPIALSTKLVPNYPLLSGLSLGSLDGYFYLFAIVESNLFKFEEDPFNISEYFQLVYIYET